MRRNTSRMQIENVFKFAKCFLHITRDCSKPDTHTHRERVKERIYCRDFALLHIKKSTFCFSFRLLLPFIFDLSIKYYCYWICYAVYFRVAIQQTHPLYPLHWMKNEVFHFIQIRTRTNWRKKYWKTKINTKRKSTQGKPERTRRALYKTNWFNKPSWKSVYTTP